MPQPPHKHRNHPPITPHPKTYFCPIYLYVSLILLRGHQSRCTTASMSFLSSQKSLRFLTRHHRHHRTPHHHTHHHKHPRLHTHIHMSQTHVRLLHFIHRSISQSPHMFTITHTLHYLIHLLHKQMPSLCYDSSSSLEVETAASAPTPVTYAEAATASNTQPPALAISSSIHSPTHSNT